MGLEWRNTKTKNVYVEVLKILPIHNFPGTEMHYKTPFPDVIRVRDHLPGTRTHETLQQQSIPELGWGRGATVVHSTRIFKHHHPIFLLTNAKVKKTQKKDRSKERKHTHTDKHTHTHTHRHKQTYIHTSLPHLDYWWQYKELLALKGKVGVWKTSNGPRERKKKRRERGRREREWVPPST